MRNTTILRRAVYLAIPGIIGILMVLIFPAYTLLAILGVLAFFALGQQLNFYKIVMMVKRAVRTLSKLRHNLRASLHFGFRDRQISGLDDEKKHRRTYGYIR